MFSKTLKNFLDKSKIKYEIIEHRTVFTALDKAATLKVKPAMVGKTVIICFDKKDYYIGLIPANKNLDKKKVLATFNKLRQKARLAEAPAKRAKEKNYKKIDFVTEKWMKTNIKGVKLGATPPFGVLYKLPFFIDNAMTKPSKIIVNGGEYELSIKLSPANLIKFNPAAVKGSFSMAKK
jgi:prolyl-tRNA editing enzyme YbaK/EbsC (Cys-tRNA(Pro) deacylase)